MQQKKGPKMKTDLHIRITAILHASPPPPNPKGPHAPRVVLVRGTVLSSDSLDIRRGTLTALFRLSKHDGAVQRRTLDLQAGRDVHVWQPWRQITQRDEFTGETFGEKGIVWCFTRFQAFEPKLRQPAPFPMPAPSLDL
jgi:hypothetical protein